MKNILSYIWNHKTTILVGLVIVFVVLFSFSVKSCNNQKKENDSLKHSIEAIFDTVSYYKGKNNELIASKSLLEGDLRLLEIANKDLYDKVISMDQKGSDHIIYVETVVEQPKDSINWEISPNDTTIIRNFDFSDKWRTLQGDVYYNNKNLGLNISKNEIYFDYVLTTKDNKVYISSTNPYVKYNEITGLVIPEQVTQKQKHWHIGPMIYGGYDLTHQKFGTGIGIGIQYSLISF